MIASSGLETKDDDLESFKEERSNRINYFKSQLKDKKRKQWQQIVNETKGLTFSLPSQTTKASITTSKDCLSVHNTKDEGFISDFESRSSRSSSFNDR
jgi:hypothetical protein